MSIRKPSMLDHALSEIGRALTTALGPAAKSERAYPASDSAEAPLDTEAKQHAAGLMRINHAGEVCAQALYVGQAAVARDAATRTQLLQAAQEESDHLAWCTERLTELNSRPSLLNPVWYLGSFAIGAAAGLAGDRWSLGFVIETERQVEAHLGEHLETLPAADQRSRAIVRVMQADEARHGANAKRAGGAELPAPVPTLMRFAAGVMKLLAYRV